MPHKAKTHSPYPKLKHTTLRASLGWQTTHLYKTERWRRYRLIFLRRYPCCAECGNGATEVDHITPHRGDSGLFWNQENWQAMCKPCHSRKTAGETLHG